MAAASGSARPFIGQPLGMKRPVSREATIRISSNSEAVSRNGRARDLPSTQLGLHRLLFLNLSSPNLALRHLTRAPSSVNSSYYGTELPEKVNDLTAQK
jgi:hypothetical protein